MAASASADRFGVTLLFSLIVHAVIVLGITFDYVRSKPRLPSLDVILVQSATGERPDKADFLAQANNSGGGETAKPVRPTQALSSPLRKPTDGIAPMPMEKNATPPAASKQTELLTRKQSDFSVQTKRESPDAPEPPSASERADLERKLEMARLASEIQQDTEKYAKRPKRKFISANTREYAYAEYMRGWVARVERVGNLNYPDEARRQNLQGQLILTVGMNKDGSIKSVDVIQPSGHKLLDDAARRIVQLAAPFPPIPQTDEKIDELYVTRTWQFLPGNSLQTK